MVALEKITRLAVEGQFDSTGVSSPINLRKINALGQGTKHDVCASTSCNRTVANTPDRIGDIVKAGVCHAFTPDGRCVSLFKTLFTNACQHQCNYCPNSSLSSSKTQTYTPEELAKITLKLYRGNYVEGLFLSSGVGRDEDILMEQMIETVRLLREKYRYVGYIHLKILPGSSYEHVKQAIELVDRVSINVEAPTKSHMSELSHTKDYNNDILQRQRYVRDLMSKIKLPAGQTTQFVVGASDETDKEIFTRMLYEYKILNVKRAYFSAFSSVEGTTFEGRDSQPRWRENRLYQMDWLHRIYKFDRKEIELAFDDVGFLGNKDPKVTIAKNTITSSVDPNEASGNELIRIPGIGPTSAYRIVELRKKEKIRKREQLARLGVVMKRAGVFLKINGWKDTTLDRWMG